MAASQRSHLNSSRFSRYLWIHGVRCVVYTNAIKRSDAIMHALSKDQVKLVLGIDAASIGVYKTIKKMNYNEKVWKTISRILHR